MDVDAPPVSVPDAWQAVQAAWKKLGTPAAPLLQAQPELRGQVLRLTLPAGLALAQGERAARMQSVRTAVEQYYPPGTRLQLVAEAGTGTAKDRMDALKREVMDDPRMKPVFQTFSATVDTVTRLDGDDET